MDSNADFRVGDVLVKLKGSCEFWIVTKVTYHTVWFGYIRSILVYDGEYDCYRLPDLEDAREYGPFYETGSTIRFDKWGHAYVRDPGLNHLYKWKGDLVYDPSLAE